MKTTNRKEYSKLVQIEQSYYKKSYINYFIGSLYHHERFYEARYLYHYRWGKFYSKGVSLFSRILCSYHKSRMNKYSLKVGLQFGMSEIGFGVKIHHFGSIVMNGNVKIGENLTIYPGVTIGQTAGNKENVPVIGDNVFIYPNAMVCGRIKIGNSVTILSNAVVTHDVPDNATVGGIPAKIISINENK